MGLAGALRQNGFASLFVDRSINFFVNEAFQFAVPAALFIVTGRAALSALVFGLEWTCRLTFLFFGGAVIDRLGPVRSARGAWLIRSLTGLLGLAGVLLWRDSDAATASMLAGCGVLSAGLFEIGFVANERLAADVVDAGARAEIVQSRLGAVDQAALIGGPVLGGGMLLLGVPALLGGYAAAMAIGLASTRFAAADNRQASSADSSAARESMQAVRSVLSHPLLRITMLTAMAANIVLATILSTLAPVVGSVYHHDPRLASLITSVGGGISLLTILLTPLATRRYGFARCLWAMTGATVVAGALATLTPWVLLFAVLLTVAYVGDSVIAMVARSIRIRVFPRERYSSLMSASVFLNYLPMPFAGLLIGVLVGRFGLRTTWVTVSLIALALGLAAWTIAKRDRPVAAHEFGGGLAILHERASS